MYVFGVLCLLYGFSYRIDRLPGEGVYYTIGMFAMLISSMMKD